MLDRFADAGGLHCASPSLIDYSSIVPRKNVSTNGFYGLNHFQQDVSRKASGPIVLEYHPPRFWKRQAGLNRPLIKSRLAQDFPVRLILRVQICRLPE